MAGGLIIMIDRKCTSKCIVILSYCLCHGYMLYLVDFLQANF